MGNTKTKLKMLMKLVDLLREEVFKEQRRDTDLVLLAATLLSFMKEIIEEILVDVELMEKER